MVDTTDNTIKETAKNTKSLEVPSHKIDEFDETLDKEIMRTDEAKKDAEYNRKKYAQLKDKYRDLETERNELLETLEEKNKTIARLKRADRTSRENSVVENRQEQAIFNIVADRMLRKRN